MNEFNTTDLRTIELKVVDYSAQQVAYALCKYYLFENCKNTKYTIIDLEELAEHILAYTKAERKMLEVNNDV